MSHKQSESKHQSLSQKQVERIERGSILGDLSNFSLLLLVISLLCINSGNAPAALAPFILAVILTSVYWSEILDGMNRAIWRRIWGLFTPDHEFYTDLKEATE